MDGVSDWLQGAHADDGLVIPALPAKHGADLVLTSAHVEVHADDEGAALAWDEFIGPHGLQQPPRDCWGFEPWASHRNRGTGVGLGVMGRCLATTLAVCARRDTRRNRFNRSMAKGSTVPLAPLSTLSLALTRDGNMLAALCTVLAERPEARLRLDEPERVARLALDLLADPMDLVPVPTGLRRETVEVLAALRDLGHVHRLGGRPVPGDPLTSADDLAGQVVDHVRAHPRQGITVEHDEARELVARHFLDIEPWPFGAVTAD